MDPIANMLVSLVNAQRVQKKRVAIPYSNFKKEILAMLQKEGKVSKVRIQRKPLAKLIVTLAYDGDEPRIHGVRRLSKPGRRNYAGRRHLPYSSRLGSIIVSTSQGIMNEKVARKKGIGGELICAIW